ncbi:hypothetical protein AgCh_012525 [Apium graveolens]
MNEKTVAKGPQIKLIHPSAKQPVELDLIAGFDQEAAAVVTARQVSFKMETESPGLAAQLDQIPVAPFQDIPAPSPEVQARVRSLTQMAVERARSIDRFISSEFRAVQYQDLVNCWISVVLVGFLFVIELPLKRNSQPNNGSTGDPSMSELMNLLCQQSIQLAQHQQQFQQKQQQLQQQQQQLIQQQQQIQ